MGSPGKILLPFPRRLLVLFLILSLVYPILVRAQTAQTWKVAIVLPLTGPLSPIGQRLKNGYRLALKEARQRGKNLQVLWIDEKTLKKPDALAHLTQTLKDPHLLAILGAYSSHETFTLATLAERTHTPLIIPSSMADRLTRQGYQWVFRICPSSIQYLEGFVSYMVSFFPSPPPTVLIYEDTPWGQKIKKRLTTLLKKRKTPLRAISYVPGGNHYPPVAERLKKGKVSLVILISSTPDLTALYRDIKTRNPSLMVATVGMGLSFPQLLQKGLSTLEGLIFPSPWIPQAPWPGSKTFVEVYSETHHVPPDYHSAEAYSALSLLITALDRAHCQENIRGCKKKIKRLLETETFSTPLGPVAFTSKGGYTHQNMAFPLIIQVQDGKLVILHPAPPERTGQRKR